MLWTIAIIFGLLWALGLATSITLGGFIHALLGVAVVLFGVQIYRTRRLRGARQRPTRATKR